MRIRDAGENDLSAILAVYNEVVRTSTAVYTEEEVTLEDRRQWFETRQGRGYPVLVAEDESGTVMGYATFSDFRAWSGYRYTVEHSVYVDAQYRGRGVAKALMAVLFVRAAALGKHVMIAGVDTTNYVSVKFHEKLGFVVMGTLREVGKKSGHWLDLTFMQRFL